MKKIDADEHGGGWYRIKDLPKDTYIQRKMFSKKVYRKGAYDRVMKAYEVHDTDDISRSMYVKANTEVWAGFLY